MLMLFNWLETIHIDLCRLDQFKTKDRRVPGRQTLENVLANL